MYARLVRTLGPRLHAGPTATVLALVALASAGPVPASAQIPDTFTNLQHFPEDITRDSLVGIMRQFSFALGVRCQHCHFGGDGVSFEGVEFDSDEKVEKRRARYMLEMVEEINERLLSKVPERAEPHVRLECRTCHRGLPRPRMIDDLLREKIAEEGADAAVAYYKELRDRGYGSWSYDFGEWVINDLASEFGTAGDTATGIALFRMNAEYYPESPAVWSMLGDLEAEAGNRDGAIESYRKALELAPDSQFLQKKLRDMGVEP